MTFLLDTGSQALWVPGQDCPSSECPKRKFDRAASSTYGGPDRRERKEVTFAQGSVEGWTAEE